MNEAIDCGERHGMVRKDLAPIAEWLMPVITSLVAASDQLEQHTGFGLIANIDDVIEDQEVGTGRYCCNVCSKRVTKTSHSTVARRIVASRTSSELGGQLTRYERRTINRYRQASPISLDRLKAGGHA